MFPTTIFLYGPSGAGKTTVGKQLAANLGYTFIDLDGEIEREAGKSIPEIFAAEGEAGFRRRERGALRAWIGERRAVMALGGGALLDSENRALATRAGRVLCLHAEPDTLLARLRGQPGQRPLLEGDARARLEEYLSRRTPHYQTFNLQLSTEGLSPEAAAWEAQILLGIYHVRGMANLQSPIAHQKADGYDVGVLPGGLDRLGEMLAARQLRGPIAIVTDENVGELYAERVRASLIGAGYRARVQAIPPGEDHKTIEVAERLWARFLDQGLERGSTVIALGGGVVGDLAGFAAATYLRGVAWVAVPTTLLAMVDASLGGKTGADLPQGKNLVGAFHPPKLVLTDPETLTTLPDSELRAGMAEVVKHGVIGDPALFEMCKGPFNYWRSGWAEGVSRAMAVKIRIIEEDPFEAGVRASLNLGHTVGHGVEHASGFRLRHGEAVAIGMVAEARLAERLGIADAGLAGHLAACLRGLGLPTEIPPDLDRDAILQAMSRDKKKAGGVVRFALPVRIGEVEVGVEVEDMGTIFGL